MPTQRLRELCVSETAHANGGQGPSACDKLQIDEIHDQCLTSLATWAPGLCLSIRDGARKKECAAHVPSPEKEPKLCPLLEGEARKRCFFEAQMNASRGR
jgi:hypothetical protein